MEKIGQIFGHNLKLLRGSRSQVDVATDIGTSLRAWQRMEKGGSLPKSPSTIAAIARYFRVPESRLFLDPDLAQKSEPPTPGIVELAAKVAEQAKEIEHLKATIARLQRAEKPGGVHERLMARIARLDETQLRHLGHALEGIEEEDEEEGQDRKLK